MIQTCSNCKNYDISISDEPCRECQKAFRRGEGKPNFVAVLTNADRIRAMTDEELADWLFQSWHNSWYTLQEWLNWLKQEADNGQHDS